MKFRNTARLLIGIECSVASHCMLCADGGKRAMDDHYPSLQTRKRRLVDEHLDGVRQELWRAYQQGSLTEQELTSTLDRLKYVGVAPTLESAADRSHSLRQTSHFKQPDQDPLRSVGAER